MYGDRHSWIILMLAISQSTLTLTGSILKQQLYDKQLPPWIGVTNQYWRDRFDVLSVFIAFYLHITYMSKISMIFVNFQSITRTDIIYMINARNDIGTVCNDCSTMLQ